MTFLSSASVYAQLAVTASSNATNLADSIMGSGVTLLSATYSGARVDASGTFTGGASGSVGLGIGSGLVLTTGTATGAIGPNSVRNFSGGGATDSGSTSLTINFNLAQAGDLFFNYVFASEEYNEYVGSQFNDTFKFLLDGPTNNIALIPSTLTPVSINNVNSTTNSAYYKNNRTGEVIGGPATGGVTGPYNIQYDGFTTVLQAKALGLSAGAHTIQLIVQDVGDTTYDSAVFIQEGSFSTTETPVSTVPDAQSTFVALGAALVGLALVRRRKGC